jgi:hypothetical protein
MGSIVGLKSVLVPGIYTFLTSDMFIFLPKPPGEGEELHSTHVEGLEHKTPVWLC